MLKLTLKAPSTAASNASSSNNASNANNNVSTIAPSTSTPKLTINLSTAHSSTASKTTTSSPALSPCGLEEHFLLRLPPSLASILTGSLVESEFTSPGELRIRFLTGRTALVQHPRFIKPGYPAILCDSPSILETLKNPNISLDYSSSVKEDKADTGPASTQKFTVGQYYKVADLNQILVVLDVDSPEGQRILTRLPPHIQHRLLRLASTPDSFETILKGIPAAEQTEESQSATLPWCSLADGLTPPLKSALKRRFAPRPLHATAVGDLERVEREVERLLKEDMACSESHFTLLGPDGKVLLGEEADLDADQDLMDEFNDLDEEATEGEEEDQEDEEQEEEEEEEEMDDFAAEIEDNLMRLDDDDEDEVVAVDEAIEQSHVPIQSATSQSSTPSTTLSSAVTELELKLQEKLKQAATVTNPLIKARIEDVIRQLEDNLRKLREAEDQ